MFGFSESSEIDPGLCPVCDTKVAIDPTLWFGETRCPNCGHEVWLIRFSHGYMSFKPSEEAKLRTLNGVIAGYLGVEPGEVDPRSELDLGIDSLDFVELVMELEEEAVS